MEKVTLPKYENDFILMQEISCLADGIFHWPENPWKPIPYFLTQQEIDFIESFFNSRKESLSEKQRKWMERVYIRLAERFFECSNVTISEEMTPEQFEEQFESDNDGGE